MVNNVLQLMGHVQHIKQKNFVTKDYWEIAFGTLLVDINYAEIINI